MRTWPTSSVLAHKKPLKQPDSLAEQAASAIRTMITEGHLPPGEALSEMALADHLGVSKTPVREALLRLKQEGLVETSPRRGTFVFRMDEPQVRQLSRFRLVLEQAAIAMLDTGGAAALAGELEKIHGQMNRAIEEEDGPRFRRLDTSFHLAIVGASGNDFLIEAYTGIVWRIMALLSRLLKYPQTNKLTNAEHEAIFRAIGSGASEEAARLLDQHIRDSEKRYLRAVAGEDEAG